MATMLDCKKIQPLLSEYVDGTLPQDQAWQVKLHVDSCSVCRRVADDFQGTARLLSSLPTAELSSSFEAALARRIADQVIQPRPLTAWDKVRLWWEDQGAAHRRPVYASAAALAALIPMAFVISSQTHAPAPTPQNPVQSAQKESGTSTATDDVLSESWNDHAEFLSSQPLGDSSALLSSDGGF